MGIFGIKSGNGNELHLSREDSPAIKYVKEIMGYCIANNIESVVIQEVNGMAKSPYSSMSVPYINVRNRIAIMTDIAKPYSDVADQKGVVIVKMEGKEMDVDVQVFAKDRCVKLIFRSRC